MLGVGYGSGMKDGVEVLTLMVSETLQGLERECYGG